MWYNVVRYNVVRYYVVSCIVISFAKFTTMGVVSIVVAVVRSKFPPKKRGWWLVVSRMSK